MNSVNLHEQCIVLAQSILSTVLAMRNRILAQSNLTIQNLFSVLAKCNLILYEQCIAMAWSNLILHPLLLTQINLTHGLSIVLPQK